MHRPVKFPARNSLQGGISRLAIIREHDCIDLYSATGFRTQYLQIARPARDGRSSVAPNLSLHGHLTIRGRVNHSHEGSPAETPWTEQDSGFRPFKVREINDFIVGHHARATDKSSQELQQTQAFLYNIESSVCGRSECQRGFIRVL